MRLVRDETQRNARRRAAAAGGLLRVRRGRVDRVCADVAGAVCGQHRRADAGAAPPPCKRSTVLHCLAAALSHVRNAQG